MNLNFILKTIPSLKIEILTGKIRKSLSVLNGSSPLVVLFSMKFNICGIKNMNENPY